MDVSLLGTERSGDRSQANRDSCLPMACCWRGLACIPRDLEVWDWDLLFFCVIQRDSQVQLLLSLMRRCSFEDHPH